MRFWGAAKLAFATVALLALLALLPFQFILFGRFVLPHASGSEFLLLVLVGLIATYITKELGVYYLFGALLVYACLSTSLPSILRGETVDFDPARETHDSLEPAQRYSVFLAAIKVLPIHSC